jgi:hypothetical protein
MPSSKNKGYHTLTNLHRLLCSSTILSVFLLAALTAVNGKSNKVVFSWFNPKYEGQTFHKVLVIGVAQDLEVRADFEDGMAGQLARLGMQAIPGNHILLRPDPEAKPDLDYLRAQIRDNKIDAVVVSRLLKVDTKVISIPSSTYVAPFPYYYSFYGSMATWALCIPWFTIRDTRGKTRPSASRPTFMPPANQMGTWYGRGLARRSIRNPRRKSHKA